MDRMALSEALEEVWKVIRAANAYVDHQAPWALRKTDPARMATVLRVLADTLRPIATVLLPFMPGSMERLLDQLGRARGAAARWPSLAHAACRAASRCRRRKACSRATSATRRNAADVDRFALPSRHVRGRGAGRAAGAGGGGRGRARWSRSAPGSASRANVIELAPSSATGSGARSACIRTMPARSRSRSRRRSRRWRAHPKVIGIGESGLDYFYKRAPRAQQQASLPRSTSGRRG